MEELSPLRMKRKLNLIEVAEDYFIEHGLHTSTMEDIAAASGISRQTVYRYYSSKEDLAFAVENRVLERLFTRMGELFGAAYGMTLENSMRSPMSSSPSSSKSMSGNSSSPGSSMPISSTILIQPITKR